MSEYARSLEQLLSLEYFGMKLGLENMRTLLTSLGNPHMRLKCIHVAGTNGKGSVSATLASVLRSYGLNVGLYTSPHLVDYRERIRINGQMIPREAIERFVATIWDEVQALRATFFEVTTALAFEHFASQEVDIAVIETGLGGRLDATNVLEAPLATVITSIGLDHVQQLGGSLPEIAREKAGIFKPAVPAIVNVRDDVFEIFEQRAAEVGCPLYRAQSYKLPDWALGLKPALSGEHQVENLRTALVTLDMLGYLRDPQLVKLGVVDVQTQTGLRARLQSENLTVDGKSIALITDVAHNVDGIQAVVKHFQSLGVKPVVVFGAMRDKAVDEGVMALASIARELILVQPRTARAASASELLNRCERLSISATFGGTVEQGMAKALHAVEHRGTVLLLGSHYIVGEYLANESTSVPVVQTEQ